MKWSCGFQVRVRSGPSRGQTLPIDSPVMKIGRSIRPGDKVSGWVRVSDDTVSRLHCELFWQEDRKCFRLLHRSTTNSTYLNGEEVVDAEVFDKDIIEVGATSLELQKADLRWSKTPDPAVKEWAPTATTAPAPMELDTKPILGPRRIPGATVPATAPSNRRVAIGPQAVHIFCTEDGTEYRLEGQKVRFGSSTPPPEPEPEPDEDGNIPEPKPRPTFGSEYEFDNQDFSYYNLILMYDEITQHFKAARVGPNARNVRIFRKQSGLIWQTEMPEGIECGLLEGDHLQLGDLIVVYRKRAK